MKLFDRNINNFCNLNQCHIYFSLFILESSDLSLLSLKLETIKKNKKKLLYQNEIKKYSCTGFE
jgi:hypothetical protein